MKYYLIYDGDCNLCVTFTQLLETFVQGDLFNYIPMQEVNLLPELNVMPKDCELGMMLINSKNLSERWQGSEAAEKIIELLPNGRLFLNAYRTIPGLKLCGDKTYLQIRDNRYQWFGRRQQTYYSQYNFTCQNNLDCTAKSTNT
jgi:predicted DCC family thiol-disulfide oxidoreductase YuxK